MSESKKEKEFGKERDEDRERDCSGEELIALAGAISIQLSKCMEITEIGCLAEFLGLLKHNLEVIKIRRLINKVESKK